MRGFRVLIPFLCLFVMGIAGYGQESLSLQQAVELARRQHPSVAAARQDIEAAQAGARGAKALTNPEIVVTPFVSGAGSDERFFILQPLEINGQRSARAAVAAREADATRATARTIERDLIRDVKHAYWQVAKTQAIVVLDQENVAFTQTLYDATKRQVDVGTIPGTQLIKADVELGRARQELVAAESEEKKAKAQLNTLVGRAPETDFTLSDSLHFAPVQLDTEPVVAAALTNRPEIQATQATLAARQAEIRVAKALRRPDVFVQARQEEESREYGVGAGFTLPFLDWGSARGERQRTEHAAHAQARRVEAAQLSVRLDVENALRDVQRAQEQVRTYEGGLLAQSEQLAALAQKGYQAGATGYLDVLEAQRTLRNFRSDYFTALSDYLKSLAQLEWASGMQYPLQEAGI